MTNKELHWENTKFTPAAAVSVAGTAAINAYAATYTDTDDPLFREKRSLLAAGVTPAEFVAVAPHIPVPDEIIPRRILTAEEIELSAWRCRPKERVLCG
jgi:hypothetical protein